MNLDAVPALGCMHQEAALGLNVGVCGSQSFCDGSAFGADCYRLFVDQVTWDEARARCQVRPLRACHEMSASAVSRCAALRNETQDDAFRVRLALGLW